MRNPRKSMDWWWRKLRRSLFYAEYRFNRRFGWFFSNPNKLDRWEREAWEKRDQ